MATTIRPEISSKNKYWIPKHRFYELKHFCLQYLHWKAEYISLQNIGPNVSNLDKIPSSNSISDSTSMYAMNRIYYLERIKMVDKAAQDSDPLLYNFILKGVTEGLSYTYLKTVLDIPCSRDVYYDRYRKFFYILNKLRD